jgi:uncharacterized membrane protein
MVGKLVFSAGGERDFRWRGGSVARIEGLADCVFALALTLIVVSLEVPRSYAALIELFVQVPVFAVCFALLMMLWFIHFRFHRRFGLEDRATLLLNALLLFLVLLYVYPLRFMASLLYNGLILGRTQGAFESLTQMTFGDAQRLMLIYSGGIALIYVVFAALYARAWRARSALELDSVERVRTKGELHGHLLSASIGVLACLIAAADETWIAAAGFTFALMGPVHALHGRLVRRAVERYRGKVPGAPLPP